ncbi:MAG: NAD-dependent epimerase/dehydratase family protein [Candidatus Methanosuratincola sp.]|jgi:UDP-glucose 4-epimerase|nr:NAD-dependent epimerase/dehydratase family protein [Candidatus Methanosuratincola sp.]
MRFLVTGGAGFIGSNIVWRLVGEGHEVEVIDDTSLGNLKNLPESGRLRITKGDVRDRALLEEAFSRAEGVFFDAARSSSPMFYPDPRDGVEVNVMGFINALEAARKRDMPIVYASTSSLYSRCDPPHREDMQVAPGSFYEYSFLAREMAAKLYRELYGVRAVGLRYFSVYGPREEFKGKYANNISQFAWEMMRGKRPVIYGDGTQTRDFVFVSDVVEANILAMGAADRAGGEVFNVGTGIETTFNRVVEILAEELNAQVKPIYVENPIKNYVRRTLADTTKASERLGFRAKVPLREGIKKTLEYYRKKA